ncbi:unnamed protein product [Polarella glacialis]|uniref:Carrier domain-containing protein n=1 Tax=Polarella glacialis TaxID=89957 RepID=A0A813EIM8_POLGL|nr:unnamed protein product [Polarella glacialis]
MAHLASLNPHISMTDVPSFFPNESCAMPFVGPSAPVQVSGSSFGFGGVNAHFILEATWAEQTSLAQAPSHADLFGSGAFGVRSRSGATESAGSSEPGPGLASGIRAHLGAEGQGLSLESVRQLVVETARSVLQDLTLAVPSTVPISVFSFVAVVVVVVDVLLLLLLLLLFGKMFARAETVVALENGTTQDEEMPDMESSLAESGVDSLSSVSLRNELQKRTGLSLPGTLMFDFPSTQAIAEHLVELGQSSSWPQVSSLPPTATAVSVAVEGDGELRPGPTALGVPEATTVLSLEAVRQVVLDTARTVLEDAEMPGMDASLAESGLDSLSAISLRNELQRQTGLALPGTLMFDYPSMAEIADYLQEVT